MEETPADLGFKDDPGAVRHGNFINYYQFHSAEQRLNAIPAKDIHQFVANSQDDPLYALDLGCNTGEITLGLYKMLKSFQLNDPHGKVSVLGIDIDPQLIKRAEGNNPHPTDIFYRAGDLMEMLSNPDELLQITHGRRSRFHLVSCLSLTMWIHLNHGDAGLQSFLKRISEIADVLIVEPQRWKNYKDAVRRMKRGAGIEDAFPHFGNLTWRETVEGDIQTFLQSEACKMRLMFRSNPSSWGRTISVYVRREQEAATGE